MVCATGRCMLDRMHGHLHSPPQLRHRAQKWYVVMCVSGVEQPSTLQCTSAGNAGAEACRDSLSLRIRCRMPGPHSRVPCPNCQQFAQTCALVRCVWGEMQNCTWHFVLFSGALVRIGYKTDVPTMHVYNNVCHTGSQSTCSI